MDKKTSYHDMIQRFGLFIFFLQSIPHVKDFLKHYGSGYTPNELLRMELAILDKLHWDLYIGMLLDFLTIVSTRSWPSPP